MSGYLSIQFGGNAVRFSSTSQSVLDALAVHLNHCLVESFHVYLSHYHTTAISQTMFQVSLDGGVLYSHLELWQVLQVLMQEGLARLNGACVRGPVFHAAALADARGGIILCGQSGSGKSTLAAWMLASGRFRYLTDEVILCAQDGGQISGFARSLILKNGSSFLWKHLFGNDLRRGLLRFPDGSTWIEPGLLSGDSPAEYVVPRLLLFLRYIPASPLRVTPLSPAESLFRLLQNLVNAWGWHGERSPPRAPCDCLSPGIL